MSRRPEEEQYFQPAQQGDYDEEDASGIGEGDEVMQEAQDENYSSSTPTSTLTWISWFCSLPGHEYFCEVHEDFIEDDFNLTGLNAMVPFWREAMEMVLDVEPDEDTSKIPDVSIVEASAELLYGLIHQRFIITRVGLQAMIDKYESGSFGSCPRVFCKGTHVVPCGRSDLPGYDTVKLYCPNCNDIYTPPSSRFQGVDGAFFGTTFPHLFFLSYRELAPAPFWKPLPPALQSPRTSQEELPEQPPFVNPIAHGGQKRAEGKVYAPRIYGFKVSELAKCGPRMGWMRLRPEEPQELDMVDWRGRFYEDEDDDYEDDEREDEDRPMEDFDADANDDDDDDEEEEEEEEADNPGQSPSAGRVHGREVPRQTPPTSPPSSAPPRTPHDPLSPVSTSAKLQPNTAARVKIYGFCHRSSDHGRDVAITHQSFRACTDPSHQFCHVPASPNPSPSSCRLVQARLLKTQQNGPFKPPCRTLQRPPHHPPREAGQAQPPQGCAFHPHTIRPLRRPGGRWIHAIRASGYGVVEELQGQEGSQADQEAVGHASALKAQTRGAQQHHPGEQEARSLSYSLIVLVDVVVVVFLQLFPLRLIGPGDFMTLCTAVTLCIFYPTLVPCYPRSSRSSRTRACEPCAACPNYTQHLRIDDMCVLERCRQ